MAIQLGRLRDALAGGMPRAGWKVGCNFPEVQAHFKLTHAVVGWLDGRRVLETEAIFTSDPDAKLHVEAELCLRLGRPVRAGTSPASAASAIAAVAPALEIVDYAKSCENLTAILAHSMFHTATIRGREVETLRAPGALGVQWPELHVNGECVRTPRPEAVPQALGAIVAFVADFLATYEESLQAGDLVLSGTYTNPLAIAPGDTVVAGYGALGSVGVTIAG